MANRELQQIYIVSRYVIALVALVIVWLLVVMVFNDRFIPPFDGLLPVLMPWKISFTSGGGVAERLEAMQLQLEATKLVARASSVVMLASFALFSGYLALIYQQKQRRLRENRLLQMKNQEIARRNEFIRYISATIGHEFKNNLARIKRRFDLMSDLSPEIKKNVYGNFDKLFSDIDIFKKIADEREAGLVTFEKVNLVALLKEIAEDYKEQADITFDEKGWAPEIFAATPLIKTVFDNIIDNSVKYKKENQPLALISVSLSMDKDDKRKYVVLSFRDQGIGMDEETAGLCFYKSGRSKEGWGQGMYFSKYVIGLHAGKIRVGQENTEHDLGTEILIHLPYVVEEAENV
jgi:signal transduction histidine kinase